MLPVLSAPFMLGCDLAGWLSAPFTFLPHLQVRSPIFQDQPWLPTPLGSFVYTNPFFTSLPVADRMTALASCAGGGPSLL